MTEEEIADRLEREVECYRLHQIQYWPIFWKETGELVGCCGIRPHEAEGTVETGFHLRPAFWEKGLAMEVARVLEYTFSQDCPYPVQKIWTGHHPKNERSQRLIQRLGFQFVQMEDYPNNMGQYPSYELTAQGWTKGIKSL